MASRIIECVPNFSEGRDNNIIARIVSSIEKVKGISVLHTDIGFNANRSVITFVGNPEAVIDAAYNAVREAANLIDMRVQKGVHPRIGATDVLPLVPISGISMNELVQLSWQLAERIGELGIPVYCYEYSAKIEQRRKLENIRKSGYESLKLRMASDEWKPDYGPEILNEKAGATVIGARNFLIAYNINLNTQSKDIAHIIASEVRESGYKVIENGTEVFKPGLLKAVKAIGWYIDEYKKAQVSMNLTNINITPLHIAYKIVKDTAIKYNSEVTGSELIGLIPLKAMLDAGIYFTQNSKLSNNDLINAAIENLGLNDLNTFYARSRILEYVLTDKGIME